MNEKLGARKWITILLVGLFGQFAWTIENMYFNVFLYKTISTDPGYIAAMVGWSAASATLTTLLMGALSDRVGKRNAFITVGYILWGLSTAAFGYITPENAAALPPGLRGGLGRHAGGGAGLPDDLFRILCQRRRLQRLGDGQHRGTQPGAGRERAGHFAAAVHAYHLRRL